jgi:hypothetical protein
MSEVIKYIILSSSSRVKQVIDYTLAHFQRDYRLHFESVATLEECDITIGPQWDCDFVLSTQIISYLEMENPSVTLDFSEKNMPLFLNDKGGVDYVLSSFYLLSGMQEWVSNQRDKWGRFPYSGSLQEEYGEAQEAWVDHYFERIYETLESKLDLASREKPPTDIVLTHDIDHLRWPILQNTYFFFTKNMRYQGWSALSKLPRLATNTRRNIAEIIDLEKKYGARSIFFWLVEKGKGKYGIPNADYTLQDRYVRKIMDRIEEAQSVNGLHKSSKPNALSEELNIQSKLMAINRYHYLLFNLPSDGEELNEAIQQDYSYGFAEQMGFRNSYSRPFHPFDFKNWRPFHFLEVPLHIMDTTFHSYLKLSPQEAENKIISFLSRHQRGSCISILWHNDYFTPFKFAGWSKVYENILKYIFKDKSYRLVNPEEIDETYRIYGLRPKVNY